MSNRVISSLPYARAEEFAIGADHPDGLADTINRALVEAWGLLSPQIEDTITIKYKNATTVTVNAGGKCMLPSGAIVIIDTDVDVTPPSSTSALYLWAGLSAGVPAFAFDESPTVAPVSLFDAKLTRMSLSWRAAGTQIAPFMLSDGYMYIRPEFAWAIWTKALTGNIDKLDKDALSYAKLPATTRSIIAVIDYGPAAVGGELYILPDEPPISIGLAWNVQPWSLIIKANTSAERTVKTIPLTASQDIYAFGNNTQTVSVWVLAYQY